MSHGLSKYVAIHNPSTYFLAHYNHNFLYVIEIMFDKVSQSST